MLRVAAVSVLLSLCRLLSAYLLLSLGTHAVAEEPARKFLDALMERKYYDTALDYLDWLARANLLPTEMRETMDYERGNILLAAASGQLDATVREQDLDEAGQRFQAFAAAHPDHPNVVDAERGLRQIEVEQVRQIMREADRPGANKKALYKKAQGIFDDIAKSYQKRVEQLRTELEAIKVGKTSSSQVTNRDALRAEYLQSRLMAATVAYEAAVTAKSNRSKYEKRLKGADRQFEELAKKYRKWLAGILSVYYRGQIQQDLGKPEEAIVFFDEHTGAMNEPDAFRNIGAKSTTHAIECWLDPKLKQYDKAIEVGEKWIAAARPSDNQNRDWLGLRMAVARAYLAKADSGTDRDADKLRTAAKATAQFVARFPGPTQDNARRFLADLGGDNADDALTGGINLDVDNFQDAKSAALHARQMLANIESTLKLQESKSGSDRDEGEIEQTRKKRQDLIAIALRLHERALQLSARDTNVDEILDLQFHECYLFYVSGYHDSAAVLGDYIATYHPTSSGARTAANIALVSYATLQNETLAESGNEPSHSVALGSTPSGARSSFLTQSLERLADHIVQTWPGQQETDDALITLISFMVRDGRFDQAKTYLKKIPTTSPRRGEAEIRTGQALWASYVRRIAANHDPTANDEAMKQQAEEMLQTGIDRMKQSPPTVALVRAVLSLAQLQLDVNQPQQAIDLLTDAKIGPKTLADKKSDLVTTTPGLVEQIYRAALRGYIGTSSTASLTTTMDALGKTTDDTPAGKRRLIGTYIALAKDLQNQIRLASANERKPLSDSFDKFLTEVSSTTADFATLNWTAMTYANMGDEFHSGDQITPNAKRFFEKSASTYKRILTLKEQGKAKLDENTTNTIRMRLASLQSRLGDYDQAVATFTDILTDANRMLNVQIEAARALQAAADAGRTEWYRRAVMGDDRRGAKQPTIWGWGKISKIVAMQMYKGDAEKKRFRDTFFDARLQMARCQYGQAMNSTGEKKTKYLTSAKRVVQSTAELYPGLGGPKWKTAYDRLLAKLDAALGPAAKGP